MDYSHRNSRTLKQLYGYLLFYFDGHFFSSLVWPYHLHFKSLLPPKGYAARSLLLPLDRIYTPVRFLYSADRVKETPSFCMSRGLVPCTSVLLRFLFYSFSSSFFFCIALFAINTRRMVNLTSASYIRGRARLGVIIIGFT